MSEKRKTGRHSSREIGKLLRKAQGGDSRAFGKLVEIYQDKALYLAFDITRDWDLARDAAQESFIRAYQRIDNFRGDSQFSTWLYRIVVNKCTDLLRAKNRREGIPIEDLGDIDADWESGETFKSDSLENEDLKVELGLAMRHLSLGQRTALTLRYLNDFTVREIAEMMGISENTVRIHIFRGLERLRKLAGYTREKGK